MRRARHLSLWLLLVGASGLSLACSREEAKVPEAPVAGQPASPSTATTEPTTRPRPVEPIAPKYVPHHPPEIETRIRAVSRIDKTAPDAIDRAVAALGDEHFAVREEALSKLEDIGSKAAVVAMGDALAKDSAEEVRLRAVEALEFVHDETAAEQLVRGLGDADPNVREAVVEAIAFIGGPGQVPALEAALAKEADREVRSDLEDAIASLK